MVVLGGMAVSYERGTPVGSKPPPLFRGLLHMSIKPICATFAGEDPVGAAKRELHEETGLVAGELIDGDLTVLYMP